MINYQKSVLQAIMSISGHKTPIAGATMNELLALLQKQFPDHSNTIKNQLAEHPTFLEISENYNDCLSALKHWRRSKAPEAEARISEYQIIFRELEQEAIDAFRAMLSRSNV